MNRSSSSNVHSIKQNDILYASPDELLQLWSSHYTTLLNDQESDNCDFDNDFGAHIQEEVNYLKTHLSKSEDNMGVIRDQITVNEVANVCRNMPNHKAPGADSISYEGLKFGGYILYSSLAKLYNSIISHVHAPSDLKHNIIIPAGFIPDRENRENEKCQGNVRELFYFPNVRELFFKMALSIFGQLSIICC